jgi:predicted RNA-binding protein
VLEGFLTVFIGEKVKIVDILESEGNQQAQDDKFNRVDIKAKKVRLSNWLVYPFAIKTRQ